MICAKVPSFCSFCSLWLDSVSGATTGGSVKGAKSLWSTHLTISIADPYDDVLRPSRLQVDTDRLGRFTLRAFAASK